MPTPTYTPLATVTLGSAAASVTFSSIPATYRDLILVGAPISSSGTNQSLVRFNSDATAANYPQVVMFGNGSTTGSFTNTNAGVNFADAFASGSPMIGRLQIMDASATDKHKTCLNRRDKSDDAVAATATRWANTAAITSLSVVSMASTFAAGSRFDLYGVIA
jgi:hypothetical protein